MMNVSILPIDWPKLIDCMSVIQRITAVSFHLWIVLCTKERNVLFIEAYSIFITWIQNPVSAQKNSNIIMSQ